MQALPSLHGAVLGTKTHPFAGSHESLVQAFSSLQEIADPTHLPSVLQASPLVQALPSSHVTFGVGV